MSDNNFAIKVENLSKRYRIGLKSDINDSVGGAIFNLLSNPIKNYKKYRSLYTFSDTGNTNDNESDDIVWALRDVSFSVKKGEVMGVIGRNGAGKSTLLKILSRITPPTHGSVEIHGRVSSLLEVGTGFHQELTGRENVYLNGTILGMKKKEIDRKFDEIIEFADVGRFLDTPVKRYSSGMRVRLAFAVAAHLEPEILIIDEVLAVGDANFQRKCMNKMEEVGRQGRTVLFVSHNMPAINTLCDRVMMLHQGALTDIGSAHEVISQYLDSGSGITTSREWQDGEKAPGGEVARLRAVRVISEDGATLSTSVDIRQKIGMQMEYEVMNTGYVLLPHFYLYNEEGQTVFVTLDQDPEWFQKPRLPGRYISTVWIPGNYLIDGAYFVGACMITRNPDRSQFDEDQIVMFNVLDGMGPGTARGDWSGKLAGVVRPLLEWHTDYSTAG